MQTRVFTALTVCACIAMGERASSQPAPVQEVSVTYHLDTGLVFDQFGTRNTLYTGLVEIPDVTWIRLTFDTADLAEGVVLRLTSLADGAIQHLDRDTLAQWHDTSAYFNGNAVRVELIGDGGPGPSRVVLSRVQAGPAGAGGVATQCGPNDDRLPTLDPRVARSSPNGCTTWLISDLANCFLTAGHCDSPAFQVLQFNVPESNPDGTWNHPGPEDQYAIDADSIQSQNGGLGNDWCYFGVFENTETGLSAFEAQGGLAFDLSITPPQVGGQTIRVSGYGGDDSPPEWNNFLQTATGPYWQLSGTAVRYQVDTVGGNSGSPVVDDGSGLAIAIHSHGGCNADPGSSNAGTALNHVGLQAAFVEPLGVCIPIVPLNFSFPDGLPETLDPNGDTIQVTVTGTNDGQPMPGTGLLHFDDGDGFETVAMLAIGDNDYEAAFPPIACGRTVRFFFTAESTDGDVVANPLLAPEQNHEALATPSFDVAFSDDFEGDLGWTVSGNATDGQWERGAPRLITCLRGAPIADADGSGLCFLTDNNMVSCNSDVDTGSTILTSPVMDATVGTALITYWRWFDNTGGGTGPNAFEDTMVIEVSDDAGGSWVTLETVGPAGTEAMGGWYDASFVVADFVEATDQFQIRFVASDLAGGSIVEAAVDGVTLLSLDCDEAACPFDCGDTDGSVDTIDFLALLEQWGSIGTSCDTGAPGVDTVDLLELLASWGPCP